jgi:hypothetical protein
MIESIDDLMNVKEGDGASAAVGVLPLADRADLEPLLEAWYRERGRRIESWLLLCGMRRLLSRAITQGRLTGRDTHAARRILQAIAVIEANHPPTET